MPEYVYTGTVTLEGVTFFVVAPTPEQADVKAAAGDYASYETDSAETVSVSVQVGTREEN